MKDRSINISLIIVSVVLAVALFFSYRRKEVEVVRTEADTIVEYRIDTIVRYKPVYIKEMKTDTMYIETGGKPVIGLPFTQRFYSEPNLFELWISGYNPTLDSIRFFNRNKVFQIEQTHHVVDRRMNWFAGIGFKTFGKTLIPTISTSLELRRRWLISAEIGYFNDNLLYGASVQYNILSNNDKK